MFGELLRCWWAVSKRPAASVFSRELEGKSNTKTLFGLIVAAAAGFGVSWILHRLAGVPGTEFMGLASMWLKPGTPAPFFSWELLVPCGVIAGFYDFEIVLFLFARLLGGKASFGQQAYLQSLFYAPLAIVQQIFAVMPAVGRPLFILTAICSLIPTTTSLKAAHQYSAARAILTWVSPVVLNVVVVTVIIMAASRGN